MDAPLNTPRPRFRPVATSYQGKKFNSPNDAVQRSNGDIFFTDPPYGLAQNMNDPNKETPFQGVYKVSKEGRVTLLLDSITRPNGIGFSPDEKTIVIANSDEEKAVWYLYDVGQNDVLSNGRILRNVTAEMKMEKGAPDGLKFTKDGYLFATGPGGVWVFNKDWKLIGRIKIPAASANCAFSADEKTLFITSHMYLLRLQMQ
jgi:gluconolactonase